MASSSGDTGRPYEPREQRYVAEWIADAFPLDRWQLRVPVGRPPKELVEQHGALGAARAFRPFMRYADAAVYRAAEVLLIEAKLRGNPAAVAQLSFYGELFPQSPHHAEHAGKRLRLVLLTPWSDPDLQAFAAKMGVEVVIWQPTWLEAYMAKIQGYQGRDATARRNAQRRIEGFGG